MNDITQKIIPESAGFPNNPRLPLLLYHDVLDSTDPEATQSLFASHGWSHSWVDGIFSYHHFHSNTHEVLGIVRGSCQVRIGGPDGEKLSVGGGDVLVLPAGTAHKNEGSSADFLCVGAYPSKILYDMCQGDEQKQKARAKAIAQVPLPNEDPVYGKEGPLLRYWNQSGDSP